MSRNKILGIQTIYSPCISLFIFISTWIPIQYNLVLENATMLNLVYNNLWIFLIAAVIIFSLISVLGGDFFIEKHNLE
jgi:hypothetical protein